MINEENKKYWQNYNPGEIPSPSEGLPDKLLSEIKGKVLDVGTGDGVLAETISKKGFQVYGIDIAENIIAENQKRKTLVKYSNQDITRKTNFDDNEFGLIIFRFTLTNIHKESWKSVGDEIFRILKPSGVVWILEPLFSDQYIDRYNLASNFIDDKNCVYVFHDKELANKTKTKQELQKAIKEEKVSRIVKHYTEEELKEIFSKLKLTQKRTIKITSPSGFKINTFEGVFKKLT
jgi:ubiquinone/menaquinone biosynthesis C-methylase UbiE